MKKEAADVDHNCNSDHLPLADLASLEVTRDRLLLDSLNPHDSVITSSVKIIKCVFVPPSDECCLMTMGVSKLSIR